ncbi:hypothetical protein MKI84_07275 [Ancylobacter sp. A5.8]|uniref:hypothetical protein n=1 Tax=Ancylobacter gelatini TaxID=2919920 RepID=UPI001F4DE279|nr:hypothetical protein [Ancylobacter gelatini]MCJ8142716.1 hypothetical protein [Ancylobacter gelatini]
MSNWVDRDLSQRRRSAAVRRPHGTGLEYGLIAAALAVAIVTVVAGLSARYGLADSRAGTSIERNLR